MSDYLFYVIVGGLLFALLGAWYIWQNGLLGTATESWIKKRLAWLNAEMKHWEVALDDKIAARTAKDAAKAPTLNDVVNRNRTDSIAAAFDLKTKGAITQEQYEKIRDDLFK